MAPDGRSVVCCFSNGRVLVLEVPSGKVLGRHEPPVGKGPPRRFWSSAQSRDGRLLALGAHTDPPQQRVSGTLPEDWEERHWTAFLQC